VAMKARHALLFPLVLAACTQQESVREIDWAKAALARNPHYEIVATDENTGVFTVRDTATGTVSTLKLKELIAAPSPAREASRPSPPPEPTPASEESPEAPEDTGHALADNQTTVTLPPAPAAQGTPLAEGPGYRITRGTGAQPETANETLEGPGYKIERPEGLRHAAEAQPAADAQAANVERRSDPIICQGDRLMRIDGESIDFSGDAVIAEKGCDLYISNARIRAGGVGIIARQARVHIANSTISGIRGSYEASQGAEIYVAQSTFTGIGRRFDGASMTDLGGNSYATH
jgi:hypothetical protein